MDSLRWILLLIGAVVVAAIWWSGYRRSRERDETLFERARRDPGDDATTGSGGRAEQPPDIDISLHPPDLEDLPAGDLDRLFGAGREDPDAGSSPAESTDDEAAVAGPDQSVETGARADAATDSAADAGSGRSAPEAPAVERLEAIYVVAPRGERFIGSRLRKLFASHELQHGELDIFHRHDADGRVLFSVANVVEPGTFDPATMDTLSTPGLALFVRLPGPPSAEIAFDRMVATARALAE
ncbi:MAG: cell division protein ZipA C-terminal FtsZ-binding domain-containing protein, partial [Halofilum sp. (in: g-proteobacteria)]|nr:cell division protein ZipA C-terminal FtsZ-binding domain-containing protein [Halofilum sp. (in: g-proteobacteria)]